jgi:FkbM family methyltransferase
MINSLNKCQIHNIGLSDADGTLKLMLFADDALGSCSFIDKGDLPVLDTYEVAVRRLEDVMGAEGLRGRTLIKMDTEGFEHHVIRGMGRLLDHDQLVIITEVMDDWLRRAGSSTQALFDDLVGRGFRALLPSIRFQGLKETLHLEPISRVPEHSVDLVFAKPEMVPEGS